MSEQKNTPPKVAVPNVSNKRTMQDLIARNKKKEPLTKEEKKILIKYYHDRDSEKVKGVFHNHECPGGDLRIPLRLYPQDEVEYYTFKDGQVTEIPLCVAKWINNNCWYPENKHAVDENGTPKVVLAKKIRRFSFESLEFVDIPDFDNVSDLVTVTPL